ncbi:MAG: branched-chain amino acid ABC transporter permease [Candidatus Bathyarchaeota archaeon]
MNIKTKLRSSKGALGVVVALIACVPFFHPPIYMLTLGITIFMYVGLAISWNIVGGYAGYISLATGAFFGIGAYATGYIVTHYGYAMVFPGVILGGVIAGLIGTLVGYPVLRIKGPYFILASGLIVMGSKLIFMNTGFMGGPMGFYYPMLPVEIFTNRVIFYEAMLVLAAVIGFIAYRIQNSDMGLGLFCIREDEDVGETIGINTTWLKIKSFAISACLMAVVGGVWGCYHTHVTPMEGFDLWLSIQVLAMGLLGLGRDWRGPLIGAVVIVMLDQILTLYLVAEIARMVFGLLLVLIILFLPQGIIVYLSKAWERLKLLGRGKARA